MKPQQRNFVVEIKSSRRQTKLPPKSIWGDTDFKALAREAEAAHPTGHEVVSEALRQDEDVPTNPKMPAGRDAIVSSGSDERSEACLAGAGQEPAVDEVPQSEAAALAWPSRKASKVRRQDLQPQAKVQPASSVDLSPAAQGGHPEDELASLEEENRRLHQLLVEHLRQQNLLLRKMLGRFAAA
jgi:hypothetical protein